MKAPGCRYAYNARGKLNRKHLCTERCSWGPRQCSDHLNRTPVPGHTEPRVQIERPPCSQGRTYNEHWITIATASGYVKEMKFEHCEGQACTMPSRHLLTCVCSKCIDQASKLEKAIKRSA